VHSLTNIAILNPENEDCTETNDPIVNTLTQDGSKTYLSVGCVDYEYKTGEQLYPIEFLNSLSP
jgi:hypothetical protein